MIQFIIRRALYSIVTLFILSGTIFLIVRLTGDPVALMAEASASQADLDRIRHQWGLDRSWPVQYVTFMQNALTGELGKSFNYRLPVSELYFQRLPNSLTLGLAFLYLPILILVIYSFNASRLVTVWGGWSVRWYVEFFNDRAMLDAAWMSLRVAASAATLTAVRKCFASGHKRLLRHCKTRRQKPLAPLPVSSSKSGTSAAPRRKTNN